MTLNKSTFVLTSWPQTSSWSWTWPFQQEDGKKREKKREGRGGTLHPNPLSPSRPDLTFHPWLQSPLTHSWPGPWLKRTCVCLCWDRQGRVLVEELELSLQTPLIPAQCITTVTHREAVRCQWLLFFFFASQDMGLNFGTRLWRRRKSRGTAPTAWTVTGFIVKSIVLNKQRKTHMVQSSCCCFPETIKNTAVRNTVALSHMCLPYCEHTLIPHTLMKDHRKILSQSNQSQTN